MLRKCIFCNILKNKNINFFETNQIFIKGPKTKQKIIKNIYILNIMKNLGQHLVSSLYLTNMPNNQK